MPSFITGASNTEASDIRLDLVRQIVREELASFAREHLTQITSCVQQTSKTLQEQLLLSGGVVDSGSDDLAKRSVLPLCAQPSAGTTAEAAQAEAGIGSELFRFPPTPTTQQVQLHEPDSPKSPWSSRARRVSLPKAVGKISNRVPDAFKLGEPESRNSSKRRKKKIEKALTLSEALLEPLSKAQNREQKKYSERGGISADSPSHIDEPNCCFYLVESPLFVYLICIAIFANAGLIGLQTNYMASHLTSHVPPIYFVLEEVFCVLFTFEIVLRLRAYGKGFFTNSDWKSNLFDAFVVLLQLIDNGISLLLFSKRPSSLSEISEHTDSAGALSLLLRIFRLIRILRLARTVHIVGEFQAIVVATASSLRPLCWTVVLLMLLIYMLGVFFTQMVTDHLVAVQSPEQEEMRAFFGSLGASMMSLFQSISDGIEWREVVTPLTPIQSLLFVMFIAFCAFAFMNMLTGIFVDKALQSGQAERRRFLLKQVWSIFNGGGDNISETGKVTWEDFQAHLQDPSMQSILQAIDVDQEDAHELFHLLDVHHDGAIEVGEFVHGCLHLEGPAKAIDLAAFVQESRQMNQRWINQAQFVGKSLVQISKQVRNVEQLNTFARGVSGGSKVSSTDFERVDSI